MWTPAPDWQGSETNNKDGGLALVFWFSLVLVCVGVGAPRAPPGAEPTASRQ